MRVRFPLVISFAVAVLTSGCGSSAPSSQTPKVTSRPPVKITQFYAADKLVPRGMKGSLCYGVENAAKLELNPAVEELWPAAARCFEVSPKVKTTYTLTAVGDDGSRESKTVDITVGAPPPRLYDLWVNSVDVRKGEGVRVCFKVENVSSVKVSPGKLDATGKCLNDTPSKTTTYKITALGGDHEMDSGTVTVKVH